MIFSDNKHIYYIIALFFLVNLFFLDSFPFVHSDEAWLASLSRSMAEEKSLSSVEDFFLITERHPHAIKSIFHIIQIPFIKISFSIFSVRIISLLFSSAALFFFYKIAEKNIKNRWLVLFSVLFLITDIQYLYISRFARQEIIILTALIFNFYIIMKKLSVRNIIISAVITGLSIGIHPNSFIIFTALLFLISAAGIKNGKKLSGILKLTALYVFIVTLFALFFIFASFLMDRNFLSNYLNFGSKHGVSDYLLIKILKIKRFYFKIFNRIAGTYYLPDIRFQLIVFLFSSVLSLAFSFFSIKRMKKYFPYILYLLGINISIIMIGKYSPPSVSFIIPFGWLLTAVFIDSLNLNKKFIIILSVLIILTNFFNSAKEITKWTDYSYTDYAEKISETIGYKTVFANINISFFLNYRQLAAYNDIGSFEKNKIDFERYIKDNNIQYLVISEELEIIYNERPLWNDLYGNLYPYYSEINNFIKTETELVKEFTNPVYPVRIVDYIGRKNYAVKIYKVIY